MNKKKLMPVKIDKKKATNYKKTQQFDNDDLNPFISNK